MRFFKSTVPVFVMLLLILPAMAEKTSNTIMSTVKEGSYNEKDPITASKLMYLPIPSTKEDYAMLQSEGKRTSIVIGRFKMGEKEILLISDENGDGKVDLAASYFPDTKKTVRNPNPSALYSDEQFKQMKIDIISGVRKELFPNPNLNSKDEFEQGVAFRRAGYEIGAVTGRLRRTGWLDIPLLKYAIKINNATELVMTKLDVLDSLKNLKVCTHYIVDGKKTEDIPFDLSRAKIKCVYKSFPVWKGKLSDFGNKLPKEALIYIKFLEKTLGVPIIYIGTGSEEHHCVERYW